MRVEILCKFLTWLRVLIVVLDKMIRVRSVVEASLLKFVYMIQHAISVQEKLQKLTFL